MLLIATSDLLLARALDEKMSQPRSFAFQAERVEPIARKEQPRVIVLDVQLGGNAVRIVEQIPAIRLAAPCAEVIALSPLPSTAEIEELNALGAYAVADTRSPRFWSSVIELISLASRRASRSISEARARRAARGRSRRDH